MYLVGTIRALIFQENFFVFISLDIAPWIHFLDKIVCVDLKDVEQNLTIFCPLQLLTMMYTCSKAFTWMPIFYGERSDGLYRFPGSKYAINLSLFLSACCV